MVVFNMGTHMLEYGPTYHGSAREAQATRQLRLWRERFALMRDAVASFIDLANRAIAVRTTLNIDEDVLMAVKELARRESRSAGTVVSGLLRASLAATGTPYPESREPTEEEFGFRPFATRGGIVTNALIDRLREETGD